MGSKIVSSVLSVVAIGAGAAFGPLGFAVASVGVSLLSSALTKKETGRNATTENLRQRSLTTRTAVMPRAALVGDVPGIGGARLHEESTGNNRYFWRVNGYATHECQGIDTVYLDGEPVFPWQIDSQGRVIAGKYAGRVVIKKHLGAPGQVADPDLVAELADWSSSDVGVGLCYIAVRYRFDQNVFPGAPPAITADIRGAKILDPRDAGTRFSDNAVLGLYYYLTNWYGGGWGEAFPASAVDESVLNASANICDEIVPTKTVPMTVSAVLPADNAIELSGDVLKFQRRDRVRVSFSGGLPGGLAAATEYYVIPLARVSASSQALRIQLAATPEDALAGTAIEITSTGSGDGTVTKSGEPRYRACGEILLDRTPASIIEEMLSAMAGTAPYIGGVWRLYAAAYRAPTMSFDEDDLRSSLRLATAVTRQERFNAVDGNYASPLHNGIAAGYPRVTNALFQSEDGGELIVGQLDQPFTPSAGQAQRVASIHLQRERREFTATADFSLKALSVTPPDTLKLTHTVYGFDDTVFEVFDFDWRFDQVDDAPVLVPALRLRQTDANVFFFDPNGEILAEPVPPSNLPNPFELDPPTGLGLGTTTTVAGGGVLIFGIVVSWQEATNDFILRDGKWEVHYKRSASGVWQPLATYDGDVTRAIIPGLTLGVDFDVRVRAINHIGARSNWQTLSNYTVGSSGAGVSEIDDFGLVSDSVTVTKDLGSVGAAVTETLDGGLVGS